jgi:hypothetical protein
MPEISRSDLLISCISCPVFGIGYDRCRRYAMSGTLNSSLNNYRSSCSYKSSQLSS